MCGKERLESTRCAQAWSAVDGGHGNLPGGGHRKSPLMATRSPHWAAIGGAVRYGVIGRHGPWLSPRCRPVRRQPARGQPPASPLARVAAGAGNVRRGSSRRPPGESDRSSDTDPGRGDLIGPGSGHSPGAFQAQLAAQPKRPDRTRRRYLLKPSAQLVTGRQGSRRPLVSHFSEGV